MYKNLHQIVCGNTHDNIYHLILINVIWHMYYYPLLCVLLYGIWYKF